MSAIKREIIQNLPVIAGITLSCVGFAGFLHFEGTVLMGFAAVNGVGSTLLLSRGGTDWAATSGKATVLILWTLLGLIVGALPIAIATGIGAGWFTFEMDGKGILEAYRSQTTDEQEN